MNAPIPDYQTDRYQDYVIDSAYEFDDGLVVIPLAKPADAPPPHFRVVRRHAPVSMRRARFDAIKVGTPPVIPALGDTPSGDKLLSARVEVMGPESRGSRYRTYAAAGEYLYVQGGAPDIGSKTSPGQPDPPPALMDRRYTPTFGTGANAGTVVGGVKGQPRLDTGRPPYPRLAADGQMLNLFGILGLIPFVGPVLQAIWVYLDPALNRADREPKPPNLASPDYFDYALAYRPNYLSDWVIR